MSRSAIIAKQRAASVYEGRVERGRGREREIEREKVRVRVRTDWGEIITVKFVKKKTQICACGLREDGFLLITKHYFRKRTRRST